METDIVPNYATWKQHFLTCIYFEKLHYFWPLIITYLLINKYMTSPEGCGISRTYFLILQGIWSL